MEKGHGSETPEEYQDGTASLPEINPEPRICALSATTLGQRYERLLVTSTYQTLSIISVPWLGLTWGRGAPQLRG